MFTFVKGSSQENYELGNIISNPVNVKGLKPRTIATPDEGKEYFNMYSDIRPLYGISVSPNSPAPVGNDDVRKEEGFWWLETKNIGNTNAIGEYLEFVKLKDSSQPEVTFIEEAQGDYKALTALKTYNYVDSNFIDVQSELVARTYSARSERSTAGYKFKDHLIPTDIAGRQMVLNYYTQVQAGKESVSLYLADAILTLSAAEMTQLNDELFAMIDAVFAECDAQVSAINAVQDVGDEPIRQLQLAAKWVYEGVEIPERTR